MNKFYEICTQCAGIGKIFKVLFKGFMVENK